MKTTTDSPQPAARGNSKLHKAKDAKNDEFYTQYGDIQAEIERYLDYNPDTFRGKTVLLPCDDPEWSNFTKYFSENFEKLGLKKLISTSYAVASKDYPWNAEPTAWEMASPLFDLVQSKTHGKIFTLTRDITGDGRINHADLEWDYLDGNGDFCSDEVKKLRDEADIIITNPPFSIFRDFWAWLMEDNKKFLIIANKNCITYKEVFPYVKDNKVWSGCRPWAGGMWFISPNADYVDKVEDGRDLKNVPAIWLTNIEHGRRHQEIPLMTTADIFKFSRHAEIREQGKFLKYDNYDAIEVGWVDSIPSDYDGVMGVPSTFLDKYCPEQFVILGMAENEDLYNLKTRVYSSKECKDAYYAKFGKKGTYDLNASGVLIKEGLKEKTYQRIFIKRISK